MNWELIELIKLRTQRDRLMEQEKERLRQRDPSLVIVPAAPDYIMGIQLRKDLERISEASKDQDVSELIEAFNTVIKYYDIEVE